MTTSPDRPAQPMAEATGGTGEQRCEQVLDLVTGQWDQPEWWRGSGAVGQGGDHQEGVSEHGQGGPPIPGAPAADLVLVQADQALAGLEALLNGPAASGDPDQGGQQDRV